jgi:hypothetical protein
VFFIFHHSNHSNPENQSCPETIGAGEKAAASDGRDVGSAATPAVVNYFTTSLKFLGFNGFIK